MKSIIHTILDYCLVAVCAAWLVYGVEGAGNLYRAWAWFIFSIAMLTLLLAGKWGEMEHTKRPQWRKSINTALSLSQIALLFWHGEMLVGGIMTFSCCIFYVALAKAKEVNA